MRTAIGAALIAGVFMLAAGRSTRPSSPVRLSASEADAVVRQIEAERAKTEHWLREEPTSYLATIDRHDFLERSVLTVGRASDNDVQIDDEALQPHHLRVAVAGDRFQVDAVDADAAFGVTRDGRTVTERHATLEPSHIQVGRFLIRLSHQRFPALVVFDPRSPRFQSYKGLTYYPPDLRYRYELTLTPNPAHDVIMITSTRGNQRRAERLGWFEFLVDGTPCRLEAVRLLEPGVGENEVSVFFRDTTTGVETYELGRYVDAVKLPSGRYLLDFNMAYNPACAVSEHYNCPIPTKSNALAVAIRAGEKDSHYH